MDAKFTPGPWVVTYNSGGYPAQIMAPNGDTGPGGITSVTRWNAISLPSSLQGFANARLIAAAPELLDIARRWAAIDGGSWHPERHADEKAELREDTHAAIAKATGGTP